MLYFNVLGLLVLSFLLNTLFLTCVKPGCFEAPRQQQPTTPGHTIAFLRTAH